MSKGRGLLEGIRTAFVIVLALVSIAGAVIGGCVLAGRHLGLGEPDAIDVLPAEGQTARPRIVMRAGEVLWFRFYEGSSLKGYWATKGFTLTVKGWAAPTEVVQASPARWGNQISSTETSTFEIVGRLAVPQSAVTQPVNLSGTITGRITVPQKLLNPVLHNPGSFTELDHNISVPIDIRLIAANDPAETTYEAAYGDKVRRERKLLWGAFLGGLVGLWLAAKLSPKAPRASAK